jgi:hypothetical protein
MCVPVSVQNRDQVNLQWQVSYLAAYGTVPNADRRLLEAGLLSALISLPHACYSNT